MRGAESRVRLREIPAPSRSSFTSPCATRSGRPAGDLVVQTLSSPSHSSSAAPLRMLLLQNGESNVSMIKEQLDRSGVTAVIECADCGSSFLRALQDFGPDVVVADYAVGDVNALS